MKKCYHLLLIAALVIGLAACQKEINGDDITNPGGGPTPADTIPSTNTEIGTWNFISVSGTVSQTAEFTQAGISVKGVTTSNFTSQNNAGTVTFDSVTMTATGVTLSVNTSAKTLVY